MPLVALKKIPKHSGIKCQIHTKLEFRNPNKTIYDRLALALMSKVESAGLTNPDSTLVFGPNPEFCFALLNICNAKKYKFIAVINDSTEKKKLTHQLEKFGACVHTILEMEKSDETLKTSLDLKLKEFSNLKNHLDLVEFVKNDQNVFDEEIDGLVEELVSSSLVPDLFVGENDPFGILNRISIKLKEKFEKCLVYGVDSEVYPASEDFNRKSLLPEKNLISVSEERAFVIARDLNIKEDLSCGVRSGAVLAGALKIIVEKLVKKKDKDFVVIVVLPDSVSYSDAKFLNVDFMRDKGYMSDPEFNSLYWWYLMGVGNVTFNTFPSIEANCGLERVSNMLKSHPRMLVWKGEEEENHNRDLNNVLGIVTEDVMKLIEAQGGSEEKTLADYKGSLLEFGVLNCRALLGDLDRLLENYPVVIIYNDIYDFGHETEKYYKTPLALVSVKEVQAWIYSVEEHHRLQYGWEPGAGFSKIEEEDENENANTQ